MRRRLNGKAVEVEDSRFARSRWTPSGEVSFRSLLELLIGCGLSRLAGREIIRTPVFWDASQVHLHNPCTC